MARQRNSCLRHRQDCCSRKARPPHRLRRCPAGAQDGLEKHVERAQVLGVGQSPSASLGLRGNSGPYRHTGTDQFGPDWSCRLADPIRAYHIESLRMTRSLQAKYSSKLAVLWPADQARAHTVETWLLSTHVFNLAKAVPAGFLPNQAALALPDLLHRVQRWLAPVASGPGYVRKVLASLHHRGHLEDSFRSDTSSPRLQADCVPVSSALRTLGKSQKRGFLL